jgi:hypothetical protein
MALCMITCGEPVWRGPSWPLPEGMDDEGLELLLFPARRRPRKANPDSFGFTWFCTTYEA